MKILRPPFEARSTFLDVTSGCSHNKCKFCNYYKDISFETLPINEIEEKIKSLKKDGYVFKRIWLQSADSLVLSTKKLITISKLIHRHLPFVQSIGCYARIDNLDNKSLTEVKQLKKAGYDSLVFGVESGDDTVLENMKKGYTSENILTQLSKLDKAGINYTIIFLTGLGGHNYGDSHAIKTAKIINQLHPVRVMIHELTVFSNTQLNKSVELGYFVESEEKEKIREIITFLEYLEVDTFIDATNSSVLTPFFGQIPENKESMIEHLNKLLQKLKEDDLKNKRRKIDKV